jgi:hypothetical protein
MGLKSWNERLPMTFKTSSRAPSCQVVLYLYSMAACWAISELDLFEVFFDAFLEIRNAFPVEEGGF